MSSISILQQWQCFENQAVYHVENYSSFMDPDHKCVSKKREAIFFHFGNLFLLNAFLFLTVKRENLAADKASNLTSLFMKISDQNADNA
jgi:hypothetical protein